MIIGQLTPDPQEREREEFAQRVERERRYHVQEDDRGGIAYVFVDFTFPAGVRHAGS